jgi:predicted double-glycine peptidase
MKHFHLLTRTRQVTEYSCGACALQAVLSHWGKEVEEEELMKLLRTTSEEGTYPEDIVRGAQALGLTAELKDHLTLDELEVFTANGDPVIVVAQVWRSEKNSPSAVAGDWDDGHYVVVLGVDADYVYFQDPYARMSKAFMPRAVFLEHWHQIMGGSQTHNPKLLQLGIFIRGERAAARKVVDEVSLAQIDFRKFGSLNLIVTLFPRKVLPYDFVTELAPIWASSDIRPDAFFFLRKDEDGRLSGMEGSALHDADDAAAVNAVLAAIAARGFSNPETIRLRAEEAEKAAVQGDFGLSAADLQEVARKVPPGHTAIVALFENVWERKFKDITEKYGGAIVRQTLISPEALAKAAREL